MPASIEGLIYSVTSPAGHVAVLIAGAVQALLFVRLFLVWERRSDAASRRSGTGGESHE
ncbi:MAG: hypothetical protein KO206_02680 [Methanomicrobiaceae archaeon]|uniref:Uncharacterized protein n=1 Tax=hydrocarbon metagenome TaxID=938273 RepID=A0A0W8FHA8_9ZZZZ|nr:hypothetical protein [Methanomicrobiaceae archaeon]